MGYMCKVMYGIFKKKNVKVFLVVYVGEFVIDYVCKY